MPLFLRRLLGNDESDRRKEADGYYDCLSSNALATQEISLWCRVTRWFKARVDLKTVQLHTRHIGYVSFDKCSLISCTHEVRASRVIDRQDEFAPAVSMEAVKITLSVPETRSSVFLLYLCKDVK